MQSMSEGGSIPTIATVPLMVRPEALAATANRLEALADNLEQCLRANAGQLSPVAPGNDEVSQVAAAQFALQRFTATTEINTAIKQLHGAAASCRVSAQQYQQTDDSLGSAARRA